MINMTNLYESCPLFNFGPFSAMKVDDDKYTLSAECNAEEDIFGVAKEKESETMIKELKSENENNINSLKVTHKTKFDSLKSTHEKNINTLKYEHAKSLNTLKSEHKKTLETLKSEHESFVNTLKSEHKSTLSTIKSENEKNYNKLLSQNNAYNSLLFYYNIDKNDENQDTGSNLEAVPKCLKKAVGNDCGVEEPNGKSEVCHNKYDIDGNDLRRCVYLSDLDKCEGFTVGNHKKSGYSIQVSESDFKSCSVVKANKI